MGRRRKESYIEKADRIDVAYVARLARLELNERERDVLQSTLDDVMAYMRLLREVDVENVDPVAHPLPLGSVLRSDRPQKGLERESVLANAPSADKGQILVPRIVE